MAEPARKIPVAGEYDVIVAGGSLTGVSAAIAAARHGAKTLIVERFGFFGGAMTAGLVCSIHNPMPASKGANDRYPIVVEVIKRCLDMSGMEVTWEEIESRQCSDVFLHPEVVKYVLIQMLEEAAVDTLVHTFTVDSIVENGVIKGIIVENKSGRAALLAKVVIDATADGDVSARAGVPYELRDLRKPYFRNGHQVTLKGRWVPGMFCLANGVQLDKTLQYYKNNPAEYDGPLSFAEMEYRLKRDHPFTLSGFTKLLAEAHAAGDIPAAFNQVRIYSMGQGMVQISNQPSPDALLKEPVDCLDSDSVTRAEMIFRKWVFEKWFFYRKYLPGFEHSFLMQTPSTISIRESRNIATEKELDPVDIFNSHEHEDSLVCIRNANKAFIYHIVPYHPSVSIEYKTPHFKEGIVGDIYVPYRMIIAREVDNLLVAGRTVAYLIVPGAVVGQAAGTAAAVAIETGKSVRETDAVRIRDALQKDGMEYVTAVV